MKPKNKLMFGLFFIVAGIGAWGKYHTKIVFAETYPGEFSYFGIISEGWFWSIVPPVLWVGLVLVWILKDRPKLEMSQVEKNKGKSEPHL